LRLFIKLFGSGLLGFQVGPGLSRLVVGYSKHLGLNVCRHLWKGLLSS